MPAEIREHISDELNVVAIEDLSSAGGDLVDISIKANFKSLGARYGADVQAISKAIASTEPAKLVEEVRSTGSAKLSYGDKTADISIDDLVVTETPKEGWAVASHAGESLALDLGLTPELIEAGLVREVIRAIQEARKQADFDISDRIHVQFGANSDVVSAVLKNQELVAGEVLALSITNIDKSDTSNELGLYLELSKA
jgi:isoleucyl-tRNA synthetase